MKPQLPNLKYIVYCDPKKTTQDALDLLAKEGVTTITFDEFEEMVDLFLQL